MPSWSSTEAPLYYVSDEFPDPVPYPVRAQRFYANLLETWLTNDTYPLRQSLLELAGHVDSIETILPVRP